MRLHYVKLCQEEDTKSYEQEVLKDTRIKSVRPIRQEAIAQRLEFATRFTHLLESIKRKQTQSAYQLDETQSTKARSKSLEG